MSILTYDNKFYHENYSRQTSVIEEYRANTTMFLSKMLPDVPSEVLSDKVSEVMRTSYKPTPVRYLDVPTKLNVEVKDGNLLDITNSLNTDIITPYGTTFVQVSERESMFIPVINEAQAERKVVKKEMLLAEAKGDEATALIKHLSQLNIKIGINVISGVMLSNVNFRSAINYNSITATARFSTMLAYSYSEIMLEGNFYFNDEDKAINWIVNLLRVYPGDDKFSRCIDRYKLALPDIDKVTKHFTKFVNTYAKFSKNIQLKELIASLSNLELSFVYYSCNLKNIFQDNDQFKIYFDDMFRTDNLDLSKDYSTKGIYELPDGIIFTLAIVILADEMKGITLDVIDTEHPELGKKIIALYFTLEEKLNKLEDLLFSLVMLPIVPSEIVAHKSMIRKTIVLSDTDSILFTTVSWIKWLTNDIKITTRATNMNAAIIAIMAKVLEHIFAYSSACMNVQESDIKELKIENEFNYDIFMRTPISKHYAGYVRFREGLQQNPYKFDLKGKNFKGSDLCKTTTKYVEQFIKEIFDNYLATYEISGIDLVMKTINFEQRIKQSIFNGDVTFLGQKPIKLARDYSKVESSNYVYYTMWMDVFAGDYPELNLPQKCKELPIKAVSLKNPRAISFMKEEYPELHARFMKFLEKYPKRKFERVLLPLDIDIPKELRSISNYRKVCATNCFSIYLILKCFNIVNHTGNKKLTLFSDIYQSLLHEVLDDGSRSEKEENSSQKETSS